MQPGDIQGHACLTVAAGVVGGPRPAQSHRRGLQTRKRRPARIAALDHLGKKSPKDIHPAKLAPATARTLVGRNEQAGEVAAEQNGQAAEVIGCLARPSKARAQRGADCTHGRKTGSQGHMAVYRRSKVDFVPLFPEKHRCLRSIDWNNVMPNYAPNSPASARSAKAPSTAARQANPAIASPGRPK